MENNDPSSVGVKLRLFRKQKGLTLQNLAEQTGLSSAYLSNIERGATSPTVDNLFKISRALGVEIIDIMTSTAEQPQNLVIRREDRKRLFGDTEGIVYETIIDNDRDLNGVCITIDPQCYESVVSTGHKNYGELGIQIEGTLQITYGDEQAVLKEGDTIYIPQNTPHGYKKSGTGRCVTYWIHHIPDSN